MKTYTATHSNGTQWNLQAETLEAAKAKIEADFGEDRDIEVTEAQKLKYFQSEMDNCLTDLKSLTSDLGDMFALEGVAPEVRAARLGVFDAVRKLEKQMKAHLDISTK